MAIAWKYPGLMNIHSQQSMINIHLNGDIIRCPDIRAIYLRNQQIKDSNEICKYGYKEQTCEHWNNSLRNWQNVKKNNLCGRCILSASPGCPGHQRQTKRGKIDKSFKIDNVNYRKIASAAHYMVKESDNKVLFLTLTFPKFKKKITENEINIRFSKFVENLRTNYDCNGYIAVRERGKINHRYHYHLLCAIPFIPFANLNRAWCNSISDICEFSKNALTSDPKTRFITNPARAMRYVCKYFAKTKGQVSATRLIFTSNNILQKPVQMRHSSEYGFLDSFKFSYMKQTSDYTTCFRIDDKAEFQRFCTEFLYPIFELSLKKPTLYAFTKDNT